MLRYRAMLGNSNREDGVVVHCWCKHALGAKRWFWEAARYSE